MTKSLVEKSSRRKYRVRNKIRSKVKPRLSVYRSSKNIYAQLIDDAKGVTIASASTVEKDFMKNNKLKSLCGVEAAEKVGSLLAERALKNKVKICVFDRGPYLYHGRVKALAEGARKIGLNF